ncbi:MAG: 16S rRNA (adenine(1518)-N(6)/adenine(1519)-N(6))-dimethyltransferase RsmA [Caulobacterales bacterium]
MTAPFAKKSLGQHFLLDPNLCAKIARLAGDVAGKAVIEVGPGPGGLTRALIDAGATPLIAIEKDARFIDDLRALSPNISVIEADALEANEAALLTGHGVSGPAQIVSNLPYNVGTPLLVKWLKAGAWRGPMTLMFQKEVAERIAAQPNTSAYGRLAVLAQARCHCEIVLHVPARAFTPPPKVDSAIVRLVDRADAYSDLNTLERVTAAAFGQRRKMLRSALKSLGDPDSLCAAAGVDPTARAETLTQMQFRALADALKAR